MSILAQAGALGGLGAGITAVAGEEYKKQFAEKENTMQQMREEAIQRLRGSQEQALQAGQQKFQAQRQDIAIGAASRAAGASRTFQHQENLEKEQSAERRTDRVASAREYSARINAESRVESRGAGGGASPWKDKIITHQGIDEKGRPEQKQILVKHNEITGEQYVQLGNKSLPYDASSRTGVPDMRPLARWNQGAADALIKNPLAKTPNGTPLIDVFRQQQGGAIPTGYFEALERANQNSQKQKGGSSTSMRVGVPAGMVAPKSDASQGGQDEPEPDNGNENAMSGEEANVESEANEGGVGDGGMSTYQNIAGIGQD